MDRQAIEKLTEEFFKKGGKVEQVNTALPEYISRKKIKDQYNLDDNQINKLILENKFPYAVFLHNTICKDNNIYIKSDIDEYQKSGWTKTNSKEDIRKRALRTPPKNSIL